MARGMRGGATPEATQPPSDDAEHDPTAGTWLARANAPILVRVPRGYAVLACVGLIVVILAAYGVGRMRGYQQGQRDLAEPSGTYGPPVLPGQMGADLVEIPEFRLPDRYYIIVDSRFSEVEARRLVSFLIQQGVDAVAILPYDGSSFYVMATRPFTRDELNSQAYREFVRRINGLGPVWREQYRGGDFGRTGVSSAAYDGREAGKSIGKGTQP